MICFILGGVGLIIWRLRGGPRRQCWRRVNGEWMRF